MVRETERHGKKSYLSEDCERDTGNMYLSMRVNINMNKLLRLI
mgnify:CR=1 FL=1